MRFAFKDVDEIIEINFNFKDFSNLINALEPDSDRVDICESFSLISINIFKELLEKFNDNLRRLLITDSEDKIRGLILSEGDINLFKSSLIEPLSNYFQFNEKFYDLLNKVEEPYNWAILKIESIVDMKSEDGKEEIIGRELYGVYRTKEEANNALRMEVYNEVMRYCRHPELTEKDIDTEKKTIEGKKLTRTIEWEVSDDFGSIYNIFKQIKASKKDIQYAYEIVENKRKYGIDKKIISIKDFEKYEFKYD